MKPKGITFLPALSTELLQQIHYIDDRTIDWWRDTGIYHYPFMLYSYYFMNKFQTRELFKFPEDGYLFGDSGGFSVVTQNAKIDPEKVIKWQLANCDAGVILDIPPYSFSGKAQFGGQAAKKFDESLRVTVNNIKRALPLLEKYGHDNFEWWGVIQGETYEQKMKWYEAVNAEYDFKGWALSPKPSFDVQQIASHMSIAYTRGIKKLHILQVTGKGGIAAIAYLNRKWGEPFEYITIDSSTYARQAAIRRYANSLDSYDFVDSIYDLKCECPMCKALKTTEQFLDATGIAVWKMAIHNLDVILREVERITNLPDAELLKLIRNQKHITFLKKISKHPEKQAQIEKEIQEDAPKSTSIFNYL